LHGVLLVLLIWNFNDTILQKENAFVFERPFAAKPRCATREKVCPLQRLADNAGVK